MLNLSPMSTITISQPIKTEFGHRFTHDFNPRISLAKSRFSPDPRADSSPSVSTLRVSSTPDDKMSTSHPHRGLPPPSAMTLPDPRREGPPPSLTQSLTQPLGHMPQPPHEWRGQEESMRNWLVAKAEEDKRKQEEAKIRQEELRLEQRRIEQSMLRESLQGGVPPQMVPMIYAGIGGANLANVSLDWLNQYASQLQLAQQQQIQQSSPDTRRDQGRLVGPAGHAYSVSQPTQQQVLPSQSAEQQQAAGPIQTTFSVYQPVAGRLPPTSAPRSATHTQLPRLTTNEMYVHQPLQTGPGSAHPLQQIQNIQQDQPASSPSIYFHHWVPPSELKGSHQPQTPASKGEPPSAHPSSQHKDSDYRESPRKRKAQDGHQANPPPAAGPQYTSPSFSTTSSTSGRKSGHVRSRSIASAADSRPDSRRDDPLPAPEISQPDSGRTQTSGNSRPPSRPKEEPSGRSSADAPRDYHPDPSTFRSGSS